MKTAAWQRNISVLVGLFVAIMMAFDKGFAYVHLWIGKLPVFVTEIVLISLAIAFFIQLITQRRAGVDANERWIWISFGLFWAVGLAALISIPSWNPYVLLPSLKRSALFYYSSFA